jgi:hypothetical protein
MSDGAKLHGFDDLERKMKYPTWAAGPAGRFLDRWRFSTERAAKANIKRGPGGWLWKGHDRRSLTSERDQATFPHWARVGSNSRTVRWGEFGTGLKSEDPTASKKRHWPPSAALEPWARAHGYGPGGGFLVARAIGRRGGLEPRRFLRNAAKDSERKIPGWLATAAREMEREASAGV